MKLRNKKTGEIGWLYCDHISIPKKMTVFSEDKDLSANHWDYNSLAELNAEWEDYEEPTDFWFIDFNGEIKEFEVLGFEWQGWMKEIGNYFETKEEAQKAVEKLKAWKRLKDKGFRFNGVYDDYTIEFTAPKEEIGWFWCNGMDKDLDLLFGGEK